MIKLILKLLYFIARKYHKKLNNTLVNTTDTLNFLKKKDELDVINVGVYKDSKFLRQHFPNSFHYLFEPNEEYNNDINKNFKYLNYKLFNIGLSNKNCDENLILNSSGSTLHKYSFFSGVKSKKFQEKKIKLKKLDNVNELSNKKKYFMKIDTEGHELNVLGGARETLKNANYVLMETRLVPCYEQSYSIEDIFKEMASNNFKCGLVSEVGLPYKKIYRYLDILWVKQDLYKNFLMDVMEYQDK